MNSLIISQGLDATHLMNLDSRRLQTSSLTSNSSEDILSTLRSEATSNTPDEDFTAKMSGVFWSCLGRKEGRTHDGCIYRFKVKATYNDVTTSPVIKETVERALSIKIAEIFPAVELPPSYFLHLDSQIMKHQPLHFMNKTQRKYSEMLKKLGYQCKMTSNGVYLELPDREALLARWDKLRVSHPGLPSLSILSSDGISSDLEFVKAFFTHDAILSTGHEFVHDHHLHLLPTLFMMFSSEKEGPSSYREIRSYLRQQIGKAYRRIMIAKMFLGGSLPSITDKDRSLIARHLPKIEATLGINVDLITSMYDYQSIPSNIKNFCERSEFFEEWNKFSWMNYLTNRFGKINREEVYEVWDLCANLEQRFDALPLETVVQELVMME